MIRILNNTIGIAYVKLVDEEQLQLALSQETRDFQGRETKFQKARPRFAQSEEEKRAERADRPERTDKPRNTRGGKPFVA